MLLQKLEYVSPESLFSVLREHSYPFIFERRAKRGREKLQTILSASPDITVEIGENGTKVNNRFFMKERNSFRALKELFTNISGYLFGYFSYDSIHSYIKGEIKTPSFFAHYPGVFIYDHCNSSLYFQGNSELLNPQEKVKEAKKREYKEEIIECEIIGEDTSKEEYIDAVKKAKEYIYGGDIFQVVISREYTLKGNLDPLSLFSKLRKINPSPYHFLLEFDTTVVGASPETLVSVEDNLIKINPIAGTRARKGNEGDMIRELLEDEKERAEHVMLVDLARNDIRKVSKPGSVKVSRFMNIEKYSHVIHLESEVTGLLRDDVGIFDAVEATFPAGTLTGAPKIRAMEIIDELEKSGRGVYGGGVGYFHGNSADLAIAIRMAEIREDKIRVRAGAGIVSDSLPEREYMETENKMYAVLKALGVRK